MNTSARRDWLPLGVLSAGAFALVLSATQLSPLLKPIAEDFEVSESAAGQLATITAIVSTITALLVAPFIDRIPLGRWLQGQAAILIVATIFSALAPSFAWLVAARVLAGLGGAVIMANCFTAAGELYADPAQRNRAVGIITSATTIAIVAGLPVVAQIEDFAGWRWAIAFLVLPLTLLLAGAQCIRIERPSSIAAQRTGGSRFSQVLSHRPTLALLVRMAVFGLAYMGWLTYFSASAETDFGASANTLSALFLVAGAAEMVANILTPALLRRFDPRRLFAIATVVMAGDLLASGAVFSGLWALFVSITVLSVCAAAIYISGNALLLDSIPDARGAVMAMNSAGIGGGNALGSLLGGAALAVFGGYADAFRLFGAIMLLTLIVVGIGSRARVALEPASQAARA